MERSSPGVQTMRRGDAGPVRTLLGGECSPAAFTSLSWLCNEFVSAPNFANGRDELVETKFFVTSQ
jgi:hypothetical protein